MPVMAKPELFVVGDGQFFTYEYMHLVGFNVHGQDWNKQLWFLLMENIFFFLIDINFECLSVVLPITLLVFFYTLSGSIESQ